jgi:mRNA interferase RelE/StbE
MPWYRLVCRPAVVADLAALDKELAQWVLDKTKWLASNVGNLRHDPIAPELPGLAKYAVGDWRIFYTVDRTDNILDVHGIIHRNALA